MFMCQQLNLNTQFSANKELTFEQQILFDYHYIFYMILHILQSLLDKQYCNGTFCLSSFIKDHYVEYKPNWMRVFLSNDRNSNLLLVFVKSELNYISTNCV